MKMSMGLRVDLRQTMICSCCGRDCDDHAPNCPAGEMERLCELERQGAAECPVCFHGMAIRNSGDFLECTKCHIQFCTGQAFDVGDKSKTTLIGDHLATILDEKGKGDFPYRKRIKELEKEANRIRRLKAKHRIP